jgi:hypothetical protein
VLGGSRKRWPWFEHMLADSACDRLKLRPPTSQGRPKDGDPAAEFSVAGRPRPLMNAPTVI